MRAICSRIPRAARWAGGLAVLALACAAVACNSAPAPARASAAAASEPLHLVVLHTNDVHGQVHPRPATWLQQADAPMAGGLARVAAHVNRVRRELAGSASELLVLDAGDWYQGTPEGSLDLGLPFVQALAAVGYDALAIGNHDFDHGLANAERLVRQGAPRALCANLVDARTGARPDWAVPARVVERGGLEIALIGLVTPLTPEISHADTRTRVRFEDPVAAFARARAELPEGVDLVIPLTHLGVEADRELAAAHPELALIVGGHGHRFLREGERVGQTLIVQAGARATVVGRVDLWIDRQTKRVLRSEGQLVELLEAPSAEDQNATVEAIAAELGARAEQRMSEVVGRLSAPLERTFELRTSPAGAWIADVLRERMRADLGVMNRGGVRAELAQGPITRRALFEIAPFDNHVVAVELSGAELLRCLARAYGGAHSGIDVSGGRLFVGIGSDGVPALEALEIGAEPLDPERIYRLATNSFLADGGDGYVELAAARVREVDPILVRDLLEEAVRRLEVVVPPSDVRLVVRQHED